MNAVLATGLYAAFTLFIFYLSIRACANAIKTGRLPHRDPWNLKWFPPPNRKKNPQWFWFNFVIWALLPVIVWVFLSSIFYRAYQGGLTLRSSRTPPAFPPALSQHLATSAPPIASVQAWPVSFFR